MTPLEVYLHIPFCQRKCRYCDFLSAPASEEEQEAYLEALLTEIRTAPEGEDDYRVVTVFVGGGTPSLLTGGQIGRILGGLRDRFAFDREAEITMEANPGTLNRDKLAAYRKAGVNRLSLGLQSADDRELALLGRIHNFQTFRENFYLAREVGFTNINVDLMCSLPGQTIESWERTLHTTAELGPEHISAYSLIIEEGTPFGEQYGEEERKRQAGEETRILPSEETERTMYRRTKEILHSYGYERYEISNYARPGKACRHNEGYWTGVEYLGLGLGASSYIKGVRFANSRDRKEYQAVSGQPERLRRDVCRLTEEERREEFFFLGLRRMAGVSREDYRKRFGEDWDRYEENIRRLIGQGMLAETPYGICLTEPGIDVSNAVFAELLL
jgi:oxygen-independent coproporphyrinogen-3 oxidase